MVGETPKQGRPTIRVLNIGTQMFTQVVALDEPTNGGASHKYVVIPVGFDLTDANNAIPAAVENNSIANIHFQQGPTNEVGLNGVYHDDLLAMVIDRLQGFQSGDYACRENAIAITKIEEAMHWLKHRADDRKNRGVFSSSKI